MLVRRPGERRESTACTSGQGIGHDGLPDGNLAFVARADRQVKVRGHRVELDEVEGALVSLASVEEAAVFTVPDGEGSSALHAAVVGRAAEHTDGAGAAGGAAERSSAVRAPVADHVPGDHASHADRQGGRPRARRGRGAAGSRRNDRRRTNVPGRTGRSRSASSRSCSASCWRRRRRGPRNQLLSGELLDSMSVLRLAAFVGEAFQIDIQPADFVVENFRNIGAIAEYFRRRLGEAQ